MVKTSFKTKESYNFKIVSTRNYLIHKVARRVPNSYRLRFITNVFV